MAQNHASTYSMFGVFASLQNLERVVVCRKSTPWLTYDAQQTWISNKTSSHYPHTDREMYAIVRAVESAGLKTLRHFSHDGLPVT
jgi:hypothetical protein